MTNEELKKLIDKSIQADLYRSQEFTFSFPHINYTHTFKGISAAYTFATQQLKGWQSYNDKKIPGDFEYSKTYFSSVIANIISFVTSYSNQDIPNINPYLVQVHQAIKSVHHPVFLYNIPEVDFLININNEFPNRLNSAYSVITGNVNYQLITSNEGFMGMMMAYEFIQKDTSSILERRNSEKKSIASLRGDFHKYLSETEEQTAKQLIESQKKYTEQAESFDQIKIQRESAIDEWFGKSQKEYGEFYNTSNTNIGALEKTYEELMRLKKPADYWKERASELKKEGDKFFHILLALVAFAVITLYCLLWITPEGMQKTFFNDDRSLAIRWSIIYVTFISFLFFAIKAVMKSMFSSYHLSRDAEERQRLTYVYLAMVKDASIDKEDRHLVMQSLFSRADTGLLKEDSSPSMPGTNNIFDFVKK